MTAPRVEITYCTRCKFLLRAAWLAQELLTTFESELDEVGLRPGSGGIFEVRLNGEVVASNAGGEMPDPAQVKRGALASSRRGIGVTWDGPLIKSGLPGSLDRDGLGYGSRDRRMRR